jgi:hypothetical protein
MPPENAKRSPIARRYGKVKNYRVEMNNLSSKFIDSRAGAENMQKTNYKAGHGYEELTDWDGVYL